MKGCDLPAVSLVVNFMAPKSLIIWIQRGGRGGRNKKPCRCIALVQPSIMVPVKPKDETKGELSGEEPDDDEEYDLRQEVEDIVRDAEGEVNWNRDDENDRDYVPSDRDSSNSDDEEDAPAKGKARAKPKTQFKRGNTKDMPIKIEVAEGAQFDIQSSKDEAPPMVGKKRKWGRNKKMVKDKKENPKKKIGEPKVDAAFRAFANAVGCRWSFIDKYSMNPEHPRKSLASYLVFKCSLP